MRIVRSLVVLAAAAMLISACQPPARWKEFAATEGGFSILLPGTPKKSVRSISSAVGLVDLNTWTVDRGTVAYMVAYTDYPKNKIAGQSPATLLAQARDGAVSNVKGTISDESDITLSGHPGKKFLVNFTAKGRKGVVHARIYFVGNRLYQTIVVRVSGRGSAADAEKCLDSFKLLMDGSSPAPKPKSAPNR